MATAMKEAPPATAAPEVRQVPVKDLEPTDDNPRKFRDDQAFKDLVESVRKLGVLQPLLVRPIPDAPRKDLSDQLEIRAGERRWRAAKAAGLAAVPCIVRVMTEQEAMEVTVTVTENLHRQDLTPLEESAGVAGMIRAGFDKKSIADKLGKTTTWVLRRAKLVELSPAWRKLAEDPKSSVSGWPATVLEKIARFPAEIQDEIKGVVSRWGNDVSIEDVDQACANQLHLLRSAPWKLDDATLDPKAGACLACPKRSSRTPGLFEETTDEKAAEKTDRCLDGACWRRKAVAVVAAKAAELRMQHKGLVLINPGGYVSQQEKKANPLLAKARSEYEFGAAKKGDRGAVPALVIAGDRAGVVRWVKPNDRMGSSGRPSSADGKPKPKSLKEREGELAKRREVLACELVAKEAEGIKSMNLDRLVRLAAVFGTAGNESQITYGISPGAAWNQFKGMMNEPDAKVAEALWPQVRDVLTERIRRGPEWKPSYAEAVRVAGLIGADLKAITARAAEEIPEPKSWAAERAASRKSKTKADSKRK